MTATLDKTAAKAAPDTQARVTKIIDEMNETHFERGEIIQSIWTAAIAQQHLLMVGPGGTGKSMVSRDFAARINGSAYFEVALDETTTPDQLLGPPDIKSMVEEGKTRRVTDGMLPQATHAFLDEFFNGNGPALHCMMPILNERIFHNNGKPVPTPLRSAVMGTNKLNADADQAALWDRVHIRHQVAYVSDRDNLNALLNAAVARTVSTYAVPAHTEVSLTELDDAHDAAMEIPYSDLAAETFLNLNEELARSGIIISTRRLVEGRKAVLAAAWLAGHAEVLVGDLSILRHLFWNRQEDVPAVKNIILTACNPGEKAALDFLEQLDKLKVDYQAACDLDEIKRNTAAIDVFKKAQSLIDKAAPLRDTALSAGAGTQRIDDLINASKALRMKIGVECFDMDEADLDKVPTHRR
jgi:MoxR-like ATPase